MSNMTKKNSIGAFLLFAGCIICAASAGCQNSERDVNTDTDTNDTDTSDTDTNPIFDKNHVVEVVVELSPEDWNTLRNEGRDLISVMSGCFDEYEFTYFDADVTIDGETIEHAGVRKKGFLGSLSVLRPSLKINFGKFVIGQTYSDMKRITLNNDRQDPSHTHQVMSYEMFRQAGVVAPRCNLAHVTVNGTDLGTYSHVESIKKPFLARHFEDNDGNLYEGQAADFTPELVSRFERKTNQDVLGPDGGIDRSNLDLVVDALDVEDSQLLDSLKQVIDMDGFFTFWAMEVITGHWDGYSGNRNNFYIYFNPADSLISFIPWGTDGAFAIEHAFLANIPASVYSWSYIAYRLYDYPETRALYHEKLTSLLADIWDGDTLSAEVDRIEQLVPVNEKAVLEQRNFISTRKDAILEELTGTGPPWPYQHTSEEFTCRQPAQISGTFKATWGSLEGYVTNPQLSLTMMQNAETLIFTDIYNSAGLSTESISDTAMINMYAVRESGNNILVILIGVPSLFKPGQISFHGFETFGYVLEEISAGNFEPIGYIGDGIISFDAAGTTTGDEVSGNFQARTTTQ